MTLTIELAPEEEARLRERAAALGVPLEVWARGVLREAVPVFSPPPKQRLSARELLHAPAAVREAAMRKASHVAAAYYGTPEGKAELADWRALDGEPFHDGEPNNS